MDKKLIRNIKLKRIILKHSEPFITPKSRFYKESSQKDDQRIINFLGNDVNNIRILYICDLKLDDNPQSNGNVVYKYFLNKISKKLFFERESYGNNFTDLYHMIRYEFYKSYTIHKRTSDGYYDCFIFNTNKLNDEI